MQVILLKLVFTPKRTVEFTVFVVCSKWSITSAQDGLGWRSG